LTTSQLNELSADEAERVLLECCGSRKWVQLMLEQRPFGAVADLLTAADAAAAQLKTEDWLEAFAAHPRIGERSASAWSQSEQAAALNAEADVQQQIAQLNRDYEEKFGFIFIVFASGKLPDEILDLMKARIDNDRETEISNAAAEQQSITRNRLLKLLGL
jgi:OHCU decarboxylase